jgi:hypothetical protein
LARFSSNAATAACNSTTAANRSNQVEQQSSTGKYQQNFKAQQTIRKIRLRNNKFSISATAIRRSSRGATETTTNNKSKWSSG